MVGLTFSGNTSLVDVEQATDKTHRNFGGSVALLGGGILGVETIFVWTPGFFQRGDLEVIDSSRSIAWMGNLMVTTPRHLTEYSLRPFASGGFGLLRASATPVDPRGFPIQENLVGFNVGGGAVGFLSRRTGIRFDLRYYSTVRSSDEGGVAIGRAHLRYMTASVGVVFRR